MNEDEHQILDILDPRRSEERSLQILEAQIAQESKNNEAPEPKLAIKLLKQRFLWLNSFHASDQTEDPELTQLMTELDDNEFTIEHARQLLNLISVYKKQLLITQKRRFFQALEAIESEFFAETEDNSLVSDFFASNTEETLLEERGDPNNGSPLHRGAAAVLDELEVKFDTNTALIIYLEKCYLRLTKDMMTSDIAESELHSQFFKEKGLLETFLQDPQFTALITQTDLLLLLPQVIDSDNPSYAEKRIEADLINLSSRITTEWCEPNVRFIASRVIPMQHKGVVFNIIEGRHISDATKLPLTQGLECYWVKN